jgi:glycosyltransferase involved in cell wall biosynthesis
MGRIWPSSNDSIFPKALNGFGVSYFNFPKLRERVLEWQYTKVLRKVLKDKLIQSYDLIISYNAEAYVSKPVATIAKEMRLPWISIIADLPKIKPQDYLDNARVNEADGRIYLSWKNYESYADQTRDLFLEGGVFSQTVNNSDLPLNKKDGINRIAYFGGITSLGGIDLFLDATRHLSSAQYEFHIIGTGDIARLESFVKQDPRIYYHGPASQEDLMRIGNAIDVFIDPRPRGMSENNFPSKILTYLGFAKPIISSSGYGIPPEYDQVLIKLEQENSADLAQLIEEVCHWDQERNRQYQCTVEEFVVAGKSWQAQSKRVLSWLQLILEKHTQ